MRNKKKIEVRIEKALDQLGSDEELLRLLEPCTKLKVILAVTRGQVSVRRSAEYDVKRQRGAHLADDAPLTDDDWAAILAVEPFSKKPQYRSDAKLRAAVLRFKASGSVSQTDISAPITNRLNEALEGNRLPYRIVSFFKSQEEWYHYKLTRII